MTIDNIGKSLGAISAYSNTAKIADSIPGLESRDGKTDSFADVLKAGVENLVESQKRSEQMSAKAVEGKADLNDVVRVVTEAELTLQTVVAVRDRMISAYQEIMRMPM
jgi:flagellar hook-basal body complex protein FliE